MSSPNIRVVLTPQQLDYVDQLLRTGLYGHTKAGVVKDLVLRAMREAATAGHLRTGPPMARSVGKTVNS